MEPFTIDAVVKRSLNAECYRFDNRHTGISMKSKLNHAKAKREVIEDLIKVFEASGVEFTCEAVFASAVRTKANYHANAMVAAGYTFSKSSFFLVSATRDNFVSWAANEYRKRRFK